MKDFKPPLLAPSILAADFSKLGQQIEQCNAADAKWIHCDIMDGHFVPNISYGPGIVADAGQCTNAFLDVHLMIEEPDRYIENFVHAGADLITVHQEACPHLHRTIQQIHDNDVAAGVAVNPGTSLQTIAPILSEVDLVLVMSVNPGFGGQSFIEATHQRLQDLCNMRTEQDANFVIEVDGGVGLSNIGDVAVSGAEVLVAGSAVFKADDISQRIQELSKLAAEAEQEIV